MLTLVWLVTSLLSMSSGKKMTQVILEWKYINYTWPSHESYKSAIADGSYIKENNALGGLKVWKNEIYLSLPRWKTGVPVTLAVTSIYELSPLLTPFPSWEMQTLDNCSALQFVLSMEIDPMGRMWIIDSGRRDLMGPEPKANCPAKLVIFDLEDNKVLMTYEFPEEVAHRQTVLLNDLVLDHTDGGWAYITDTDFQDPGIIVFSLQARDSWKIRDDTMRSQEIAYDLTIEGMKMTYKCPINGIALSPIVNNNQDRWVYYTAVASFEVHSIPTSFMKSRMNIVREMVRSHGRKSTQTDGMAMSSEGLLYYGLLANNAIGMWDTKRSPVKLDELILVRDHQIIQWPVSFAFDYHGRLWFVTNRAYRFQMNLIDLSEINYRIFVADTHIKSYQYYENGTAPMLLDISP